MSIRGRIALDLGAGTGGFTQALLEGDLTIGEKEYSPGDYAWVAAGIVRGPSSSREGALALASFGGPARWKTVSLGEISDPSIDSMLRLHWEGVSPTSSPFGAPARRLRGEGVGSAWVIEDISSAAARHDAAVESFSIRERSWAWVQPGRAIPLGGPRICWLREPDEKQA